MAAASNPKLIGGFVLGAMVLAVIATLAIGGARFFQRTIPVVMYFPRSVAGLNVGAPVTFRGVKLGEVTSIFIGYDPDSRDVIIPVFAELFPQSVVDLADMRPISGSEQREQFKTYIEERGLRAQLSVSSIVTGQLAINLDFFPAAVARTETTTPRMYPDRIEIPTIRSTLEEVQATLQDLYQKLSKLPLEDMIADARAVLQGANQLVNNPKLSEGVDDAAATLAAFRRLADTMQQEVTPLLKQFAGTLGTADVAFRSINARAVDTRGMIDRGDKAVEELRQTLVTVQALAKNANALVEPGAPLNYELISALREAASAARSLAALANTLDRNPNAVIFGRVPQDTRRP